MVRNGRQQSFWLRCALMTIREGKGCSRWHEGPCSIALPASGRWVFTHADEHSLQLFQELSFSDSLSSHVASKFSVVELGYVMNASMTCRPTVQHGVLSL